MHYKGYMGFTGWVLPDIQPNELAYNNDNRYKHLPGWLASWLVMVILQFSPSENNVCLKIMSWLTDWKNCCCCCSRLCVVPKLLTIFVVQWKDGNGESILELGHLWIYSHIFADTAAGQQTKYPKPPVQLTVNGKCSVWVCVCVRGICNKNTRQQNTFLLIVYSIVLEHQSIITKWWVRPALPWSSSSSSAKPS